MHGRYEDITKVDFTLTEPSQMIGSQRRECYRLCPLLEVGGRCSPLPYLAAKGKQLADPDRRPLPFLYAMRSPSTSLFYARCSANRMSVAWGSTCSLGSVHDCSFGNE